MLIFFPLWPIVDTPAGPRCACADPECDRIGKHPRYSGWRDLQESMPVDYTNYGVRTGRDGRCIVIDCDNQRSRDEFEAIALKNGSPTICDTLTVKTTRGWHYYFEAPSLPVANYQAPKDGPNAGRGKLGSATDVRGEGGFVVGPGSRHVSGGTYEVVNAAPLAPMPDWLVELCRKKETPSAPAHSIDSGGSTNPREVARRKGLARDYLALSPRAIEKAGGEMVTWSVCLHLTRTLELSPEASLEILNEAWNPECSPPWPDEQLLRKLREAQQKGTTPTGCAPDGFFDRAQKGPAAPIPPPAPSTTVEGAYAEDDPRVLRRRVHDPAHRYSYDPGVHVSIANQRSAVASLENVLEILLHRPAWRGVFQYDEFAANILAVDPPTPLDAETPGAFADVDFTRFRAWCSFEYALTVSEPIAVKAIEMAARRCSYHPVREYLQGLEWDGEERLDRLADVLFGHEGIENDILAKFLIGAVRRILYPGCKFDTMLVLVGPMGYRKSQFVSTLFGEAWTNRSKIVMGSKDGQSILAGSWVHEIPELSTFRYTDAETRKAFLRETFDKFRRAYTKNEVTVKRSCCFVGTTNDETFLDDDDRAVLAIAVTEHIDLALVRAFRDQIWAEAAFREAQGVPHWFEDDSALRGHRERRTHEDPWLTTVRERMSRDPKREWTVADLLGIVVGIPLKDRTRVHEMRINRILKSTEAVLRRTETARLWHASR